MRAAPRGARRRLAASGRGRALGTIASVVSAALATIARGPDAHAQARIPPAPEARLDAVHGAVEVSSRGTHPGAAGEVLRVGAVVRAPAGASARIVVAGGAEITLAPESSVALFPLRREVALNDPASRPVVLLRGALAWHRARGAGSARADPPVAVSTASALVVLGAGDARVVVDEHRDTTVTALRGAVQVREGARRVRVREGFALRITATHTPAPPARLPPPPAWVAPPPRLVLAEEPTHDLSGEFALTPGVAGATVSEAPVTSWRVVIARDPRFLARASDEVLPAATTRFVAHALPPGDYYVRVSALDANQLEGAPGDTAHTRIAALQVTPGEPGRRAVLAPVAGLLCGLDGATPAVMSASVQLVPGMAHRLHCVLPPDAPTAPPATPSESAASVEPPAVDAVLSAARSGPLVHRVRTEPRGFDPHGGERTLVLQLADALEMPVAYAEVSATSSAGAVMNAFRETPTRGTYTSTIRWRAGASPVRVHFVVNGVEEFDYTLGE